MLFVSDKKYYVHFCSKFFLLSISFLWDFQNKYGESQIIYLVIGIGFQIRIWVRCRKL